MLKTSQAKEAAMQPVALLGIAAGVIGFVAFIPYIVTTLFGYTKPHRATWLIWTIAGGVLAASYYSSVRDNTFWVPVSYFIGPLVVAILSIWYGEGGLERNSDRIGLAMTGFGALLGLTVWSPIVTLWYVIIVDLIGLLPTLRKTYHNPASENLFAWSLFLLANTINFSIADSWNLLDAGSYLVFGVVASTTVVLLIALRRYAMRARSHP